MRVLTVLVLRSGVSFMRGGSRTLFTPIPSAMALFSSIFSPPDRRTETLRTLTLLPGLVHPFILQTVIPNTSNPNLFPGKIKERELSEELLFLGMIIKGIDIEGFRGFKKAKMDFDPHLNVIVGVNGAGKTTLLEAIVKTMAVFTRGYVEIRDEKERESLLTSPYDLNNDSEMGGLIIKLELGVGEGLPIVHSVDSGSHVFDPVVVLESTIGKVWNQTSSIFFPRSGIKRDSEKEFISPIANLRSPSTIPILNFFPVGRGTELFQKTNKPEFYEFSQLETWGSLVQSNIAYSKFLSWFYQQENEELRAKRHYNKLDFESPSLKMVRRAMVKTINSLFDGDFSIESGGEQNNRTNETIPTLFLVDSKTGKREQLTNLSHGERAIISLVAGIAYNLSIAKDFTRDDDFLSSPGIILIDEIESHLHPKWQRQIIPLLRKIFPNIQFFITTHSPQVVASVNSRNLVLCDDFELKKVNFKSLGSDSNSILKFIFDTSDRPAKIVSLIQDFDDLIDKEAPSSLLVEKRNQIEAELAIDPGTEITSLLSDLDTLVIAHKYDMNEVD